MKELVTDTPDCGRRGTGCGMYPQCAYCAHLAGVLIDLASAARRTGALDVPDAVASAAVTLFDPRGSRPDWPAVTARRVPARPSWRVWRRPLRFGAGEVEIDIDFSTTGRSGRISLAGLVTHRVSGVPMRANITARRHPPDPAIAWTHTNSFGEFLLEYEPPAGVLLEILVPGPSTPIEVQLDDVEGQTGSPRAV